MSDIKMIEPPDGKKLLEERQRIRVAKGERLRALHKLKSGQRQDKTRFEALVKQGTLKSAADKKSYAAGIRKIIGEDPFTWKSAQGQAMATNTFSRSDFNYIPRREIAELLGPVVPTCRCGEADLYLQPPWTGVVNGAYLDYWLWGDGQGHVHDWNDAPPDFQWIVRPQAGQVTTASAEMQMSVDGANDGWNQSWATLSVDASWLPTSPGRFTAHVHFGGPNSLVAAVAGDNCEVPPWDDDAYFGAWISLWVGYADTNWVTLGDAGWVTIADRYECVGWNAIGQAGWYWGLDHWLALGEYSIPVNKRVYLRMGIELETSAGSDDECYSGVSAGPGSRLLITPVITGTQCARI